MKITIRDLSMSPLLLPDDVIYVESGLPIPDGRICFVKHCMEGKFRQVYKVGQFYCLKALNPEWLSKKEYVPVEEVKIFVISEVSRLWLILRLKTKKR